MTYVVGVRRLLSKQREEIEDKSEALEKFAREVTNKVNEAKYQAGFWMQDLDQFEYWRWIVCLGKSVEFKIDEHTNIRFVG